MRALIVGGLGFFGSHIVEKLSRENYEIGILDDQSSGMTSNVHCPVQQFHLRADDHRCLEVMLHFMADCVIHCAWQAHGTDADPLDATGLNGLDNLLKGAVSSGVKSFLLAEAYEGDAQSQHLQKMAEQLCQEYQGKQGLRIGIFSITRLYGPRMTANGPGGVLMDWIKAAEQQEADHPGEHDGTRVFTREQPDTPADWLYVTDAVEAVFRFAEGVGRGSYVLSSSKAYTRQQIILQIGNVNTWMQQVETWMDLENADRFHALVPSPEAFPGVLNTAARHDLDWMPQQTLSEGLLPTLQWYAAQLHDDAELSASQTVLSKDQGNRVSVFRWNQLLQAILPFAENALAFCVVLLLEYGMHRKLGIWSVDLKVIYIVLISALFGMKQSLFAVLLSMLAHVAGQAISGPNPVSLVLDAGIVVQWISYTLVSLAVYFVVDMRNRKILALQENKVIQQKRFELLQQMYTDTARVKNELQHQIIRSDDSLGHMHAVSRELDGTDVHAVQQKVLGVLSSILKHNRMAFYTLGVEGRYFRCLYRTADGTFLPAKSYRVERLGGAMQILKQGEVHVNREMNPEWPAMMAPVMEGDTLIGMVALYDIASDRMTLYFQNLFLVVTGMVADALVRASKYEEIAGAGRYWEGTSWLSREAFAQELDHQRNAVNTGLSACTQLYLGFRRQMGATVDITEPSDETVHAWLHKASPLLSKNLRHVDIMGLDAEGLPVVLLANASLDEAQRAMLRIGRSGLKVTALLPLNAEVVT